MTKRTTIKSCLLLLASATIMSAATIINGSFEQPTTASFIFDPVDPTGGWTFAGRSGVASSTFFALPAPDGTQAAFLQQFSDQPSTLSSITQNLTAVAPSTLLTFYLARRPGDFAANPVVVTYAGNTLGTFTPLSTTFTQFSVNLGAGAAPAGALVFRSAATTTADLDTAIDLVSVAGTAGVPEPASATLCVLALGSLALAGLRRRATR